MAEIRKHRPKTSAIGDLVRAQVDAGPRPVDPGEVDLPTLDPFFAEDEPTEPAEGTETEEPVGLSDAAVITTGEWFTIEFPDENQ